MRAAIDEARAGLAEGGIPIGSVLVHENQILGRGHNRRVQSGSSVLHGEMDALENAGRQPTAVYRECTLYTTLSPCAMCSGAILLYGIPCVVIGENRTFRGEEGLLASRGVQLEILQDETCIDLMRRFIDEHPEFGLGNDVHVVRLEEEADLDEVVEWMDWMNVDGLRAPSPAAFVGGVHEMPAGYKAFFTVDLEPGRYAWIAESGAARGMVEEFTVE